MYGWEKVRNKVNTSSNKTISGVAGCERTWAEPRGEEEAEGADRHNVKPPQHLPSLTSRQDTARGTPLPQTSPSLHSQTNQVPTRR
ncbi:hypothetical protein Pcinc_029963 [Petrolisthes cinctipes]|uniref:Uncharacterized protein n=1 Tax=Petrolisthes cinctipes TaxID=88211 RepID=A0AAE1EZT8_PETCI|nr:hypothetical protein Pcinc_029963 [Petrolisthes cinctipes]